MNKGKTSLYLVLILFVVCLLVLVNNNNGVETVDPKWRRTLAKGKSWDEGILEYYFYVGNKKYLNSEYTSGGKGQFFVVAYDSVDPRNAKLLEDSLVTDPTRIQGFRKTMTEILENDYEVVE